MNRVYKLKCVISLLVCFSIMFSTIQVVHGGNGVGGILGTDTDIKDYQSLTFTVDSVDSTSGLQAFAVGWNVRILNTDGSTFTTVSLDTEPVFDGRTRTYYLPLSKGYKHTAGTNEIVSPSIESMISSDKLDAYKDIVTQDVGSTFKVDAHIQKYTYNDSRTPKYQPVSPAIYADNMTDINNYFSEFSLAFKDNLPGNYFGLSKTFVAEPKEYTVKVQYWENTESGIISRADIMQSEVVVSTTKYSSKKATFTPTTLPTSYTIKSKKFQYTSDMPTSTWTDYNTWDKIIYFPLAVPNIVGYLNILIEKPFPPEPETGNIHIKCLDYKTNTEISNTAQTISNVPYGTAKNVSSPLVGGYTAKGSYSSFSSSTPSTSSMQSGVLSQSVTLSSTNKDAYVYFWYDAIIGPVAYIDGPTKVKAGNDFDLSGSRSYCKQTGATIVKYEWSGVSISGVSGTTSLGSPGIYTITLKVTDSNGLTGSTTHNIEATPPTPSASFSLSGKIKENRKITVDARDSDSPDNYPIDWARTTWKIEPDTSTGATWEMGVRLSDGTVKIINQTTDQSILRGQSKLYFQARYAGTYKVTLIVTNTYPASDTYNGTIVVAKDLAPIADLDVQATTLREYTNPIDNTKRNYGIIPVIDHSYSADGDSIGKRTWCYRYNSQNNKDSNGEPIFTDDVTIYKYLGNLGTPFDIAERQRLVVNNDNDTNVEVMSYDVGRYMVQLIAEETIADDETIKELLLPTDTRTSTLEGW